MEEIYPKLRNGILDDTDALSSFIIATGCEIIYFRNLNPFGEGELFSHFCRTVTLSVFEI